MSNAQVLQNVRDVSRNYQKFLFIILVFLAIFHIPVVWRARNAIGLFDYFLVFCYVSLFIQHVLGQRITIHRRWAEYFLAAFLYTSYLLFSHLINPHPKLYTTLLIVKFIENNLFFLYLIIYFDMNRDDTPTTIKIIQVMIFLLLLYQLYFYFSGRAVIFGWGWKRIGLPFMYGTASNPAGFVLGVSFLVYLGAIFKVRKRTLFSLATFLLIPVALVFTVSRTNIIALLTVLIIYYLSNILRDRKALIVTIIIVSISLIVFMLMARFLAARSTSFADFYTIIQDPSSIFEISSFVVRYAESWPQAYSAWREDVWTILFGNGLGLQSAVDNTYLRLLANQGLIGLVLFFYVWVGFYLQNFGREKWIRMLVFFILINAIAADTLTTSFRTIQIYYILLLALIYSTEYIKEKKYQKEAGGVNE